MNDFFAELFSYSHHYNQQLADILMAHSGVVSERSLKLFSHVVNAHQIWNARILNTPPGTEVWYVHQLTEIRDQDNTNYTQSLELLKTEDLSRQVSYINSRGEAFTNSVRDILFHVINHSTYHRAQIASDLKQGGIEPLITDYIFYKR